MNWTELKMLYILEHDFNMQPVMILIAYSAFNSSNL